MRIYQYLLKIYPASPTSSSTGAFTAIFAVPGSATVGIIHTVTISDGGNTMTYQFPVSISRLSAYGSVATKWTDASTGKITIGYTTI
jgi:hypothetical protein